MQYIQKLKVGLPVGKQQADTFLEVFRFLEENDDKQISIHENIEENLGENELSVYGYPHYEAKAQRKFWIYFCFNVSHDYLGRCL